MASSDQFVEQTTSAAAEEKAKLQKHFSRFDIYFFLICTIVGVDTLGQVASNGAEGLTWLLILAVLFFIPYAFLTAELGAAFTEEGGSYVWTRLAWGRFVACINAVFYWFSNPVWIGGALVLLTLEAVNTYFFDIAGGFLWVRRRHGLHLVQRVVGDPLVRYRQVDPDARRVVPHVLLGGLHDRRGDLRHLQRAQPAGGRRLLADLNGLFIVLVPLLFFNYVGFELPNAAGDEMEDPQRDVPVTVLRACITAILMYGLPILAIVCG